MKNICFIHIPKCGGTSIRASMNKHWLANLKRNQISLNHPASAKAAQVLGKDILSYREELLNYYLSFENKKYIMGHFRCTGETRQNFQEKWQFVTLIREPVNRWYSHYYFDRYRERNLKYKKTDLELAAYLESDEGTQNARLYTRHFSGFVNNYHEISEQYSREAIDNVLKFDVFGILEDLEGFTGMYRQNTGMRLNIPYKNKNPKKNYKKRPVSEELIQRIHELCKYDTAIYNSVKNAIENKSNPSGNIAAPKVESAQKLDR